jgi:aquaporin Z
MNKTSPLTKACIAELFGTFTLVFVGAGTGALGIGGLVGVALAHGLVIVAFAYAFGYISGAAFNPSVSLALFLTKRINLATALAYTAAQIIGGIIAAFILLYLIGGATGLGMTSLGNFTTPSGIAISISPLQGIICEAILTSFLVSTILHTTNPQNNTKIAGLAIGLSLSFSILVGGPLTGASLNLARSLGPAIAMGDLSQIWIYVVGPFIGAALAVGLYLITAKTE